MYSVVLMTALTAGGNAPDFFWRRHACHGGCYSCYACSGCYGCYGCYGCSGYGCYGGCYSSYHGCHGGYGHWGYGHGHACFSAYQCHGCFGCSGWNGCYGCFGCYAPVQPSANVAPGTPSIPNGESPPPGGKGADSQTNQTNTVRSSVTIEMPAEAKLYVDGVLMKTQSAKRVFVTPELPRGKRYYYDLKAKLERNGQPITISGRVIVTPGEAINASLSEPTANGTFVVHKD